MQAHLEIINEDYFTLLKQYITKTAVPCRVKYATRKILRTYMFYKKRSEKLVWQVPNILIREYTRVTLIKNFRARVLSE